MAPKVSIEEGIAELLKGLMDVLLTLYPRARVTRLALSRRERGCLKQREPIGCPTGSLHLN